MNLSAQFSVDFRFFLPFFLSVYHIAKRFSLKDDYYSHEHIAISYCGSSCIFFLRCAANILWLDKYYLPGKCFWGRSLWFIYSTLDTPATNCRARFHPSWFILYSSRCILIGHTIWHLIFDKYFTTPDDDNTRQTLTKILEIIINCWRVTNNGVRAHDMIRIEDS